MTHILLDVDGVLADFVGHVINTFEKHGLRRWNYQDVNTLDLPQLMLPDEQKIYDTVCREPGWCSQIPWYTGARLFLRQLQHLGTVEVLTTPWTTPGWKRERTEWLRPYFDGCITFSDRKAAHDGDILIEDTSYNTSSWWKPGRCPILIDRPWNRHDRFASRAADYTEVIEHVRNWTQ
jgi:5'(3')-deoxyribonucleotidase